MAFTLDAVLDLGGEKEDYEQLQTCDNDDEEAMEFGHEKMEKMTDETLTLDNVEIRNFISKLGLNKAKVKNETSKETDKKLDTEQRTSKKKTTQKKVDPLIQNDSVEKKHESKRKPLHSSLLEQLQASAAKSIKHFLVSPGTFWFHNVPDVPSDFALLLPDAESAHTCLKIGATLLEHDTILYKQKKDAQKSGDVQWLTKVLTSGTLSDKLAALALQIQESPVHQVDRLCALLNMMKKKSKREALMAVDTMKQLWLTDLLPENRRLKPLSEQPLVYLSTVGQSSGSEARDRLLLFWYFEDCLHNLCGQVIEALQMLIQDVEENVRKKTLGIVYDLLTSKPEQEQELLSMLVNKLGDPTRQVSSKAVYLLLKLVNDHPNMKLVVVCDIEKLLYRANISERAQYYAICFLNQLILTHAESQLADRLVDVYFSFFKLYIKKETAETRMLASLLCGVNRAFPFSKIDNDGVIEEHLDTLFKVVHVGTFNTSVQAFMLLFQVMESRKSVSDRFYQALYEKLLDPGLRLSSKHAMFLNVLFKALKADPSLKRVMAFIKRQLQVCFYQRADFTCAMLYLVSELEHGRPYLLEKLCEQIKESYDEEHFEDIDDGEGRGGRQLNSQSSTSQTSQYKPRHRNPLYAGTENTSLWELNKLVCHFHPSVSRFATDLLQTSCIEYESDPLKDFALIRFLDRFVYKNPKKKATDHGGSLMQPKVTSARFADHPVNSKKFLSQAKSDVREDELFFYKYFTCAAKRHRITSEVQTSHDEDIEDFEVDDDEVEPLNFATALAKSKSDMSRRSSADNESSDNLGTSDEEDQDEVDIPDEENLSGNEMTEAGYEKLLLENMSSEEEEDHKMDQDSSQVQSHKNKRLSAKDRGSYSLFASADEFAHLLEENQSMSGGGSDALEVKVGESRKQLEWEQQRAGDWKWKKNRKRKFRDRDQSRRNTRKGTGKTTKSSRPMKRNVINKKSKGNQGGRRK